MDTKCYWIVFLTHRKQIEEYKLGLHVDNDEDVQAIWISVSNNVKSHWDVVVVHFTKLNEIHVLRRKLYCINYVQM